MGRNLSLFLRKLGRPMYSRSCDLGADRTEVSRTKRSGRLAARDGGQGSIHEALVLLDVVH